MKPNAITWTILAAVVLGGAFLLSSTTPQEGVAPDNQIQVASALTVDKELHDFGEVDIYGGVVTTEFQLTNTGTEDVTITDGTTSCGCTNAEIGGIGFGMHEEMARDFVIPGGETKPLTVIYDPLAHGPSGVGLAQRSVYLATNSSVTPELEVRIKALVTDSN